MGNNCLKQTSNETGAQNEEQYEEMVREAEAIRRMGRTFTESRSETKKKMEEEVERERRGGVVRIKVVVSQEELRQILSCDQDKELKYSSVEKLLESAMKLRGTTTTRISQQVRESGGGFTSSNWRPALESIPEEH
ncbi:hypothetical protein ACOSP7_002673 [Xanthoceras sorbifolium]|uniref:Uncharacterized protein n=1 Tax=Xanthoceras sorbifolium TaxID=99658 RepID=A0ABQ8IJC7_9ROSI|nr:hypothetical protein JRO89_XS01G0141100 [Xanthoceras sorbifolium]